MMMTPVRMTAAAQRVRTVTGAGRISQPTKTAMTGFTEAWLERAAGSEPVEEREPCGGGGDDERRQAGGDGLLRPDDEAVAADEQEVAGDEGAAPLGTGGHGRAPEAQQGKERSAGEEKPRGSHQ